MSKQIVPAILTKDTNDLKLKLESVSGLVEWVHIDIMDGKFADNTSISLDDLAGIDHKSKISIHLMVERPLSYLEDCKQAGVQMVIFHIESDDDPKKVLSKSSDLDMSKGIALKPETPIEALKDVVSEIDMVLFLAVKPGFSGQKFIPSVLDKVKQFKALYPKTHINVDGGINMENISEISQAGADSFAMATEIFGSGNIEKTIKNLQAKL